MLGENGCRRLRDEYRTGVRDAEPDYETAGAFRANGRVLRDGKSRIRLGLANIRNAIGFATTCEIGCFSPHYTRSSPATP
ncbi:hypothetical protein DF047_06415 [Burkholderia cenocepacia]|nr:hypothetical protein DF047_06415 [Burkholderia cenocepacia]